MSILKNSSGQIPPLKREYVENTLPSSDPYPKDHVSIEKKGSINWQKKIEK